MRIFDSPSEPARSRRGKCDLSAFRGNTYKAGPNQRRCEVMNTPSQNGARSLGAAGWIAILVLLAFLAVVIFYAVHGWSRLGDVGIPPIGWAFLIAGAVLTILVGGGLMALMFYSSRKGRDI